jgi:hypothetical protein
MNCFLRVGVLIISLPLINSNVSVLSQVNQAKENPAKTSAIEQQTNLSGIYEGVVDYPDGGLRTKAILTIKGDTFLLSASASDSVSAKEIEGRIITHPTANHIAAVIVLRDTSPPTIISIRALLKNGNLSLMSAPGEKRAFSFAGHLRRKPIRRHKLMGRHLIPQGERISPPSPAKVQPSRLPKKRIRSTSGRP